MSNDQRDLLTIEEARTELRCCVETLRKEIAEGKLQTTRIRRRIFVHREDLKAYIQRQRAIAPGIPEKQVEKTQTPNVAEYVVPETSPNVAEYVVPETSHELEHEKSQK